MSGYAIGEVCRRTGLSPDTLRYYEKIGLLPRIARDAGGRRRYEERDLARLAFIRRAQAVQFSLAEIGQLLRFRDDPVNAQPEVLTLTERKYQAVEDKLEQLHTLQAELSLLLSLCRDAAGEACPIIDRLEEEPADAD